MGMAVSQRKMVTYDGLGRLYSLYNIVGKFFMGGMIVLPLPSLWHHQPFVQHFGSSSSTSKMQQAAAPLQHLCIIETYISGQESL